MPNFRYSTKKKAIAGLGLENRPFGGVLEVEIGTASQLAKEFKCRGSELVTCDPVRLDFNFFIISLLSASVNSGSVLALFCILSGKIHGC